MIFWLELDIGLGLMGINKVHFSTTKPMARNANLARVAKHDDELTTNSLKIYNLVDNDGEYKCTKCQSVHGF
jgi:hypothetical protein